VAEGCAGVSAYKDTVAEKLLTKLYTFDITEFASLEGHEIR